MTYDVNTVMAMIVKRLELAGRPGWTADPADPAASAVRGSPRHLAGQETVSRQVRAWQATGR